MDILNQIKIFKPRDLLETEVKEKLFLLLNNNDESIFYRENEEIHITASGFILNPEMDQTLMVYHNIYQSLSWTGGHADGEKDLLSAAIREAKEETGIEEVYPLSSEIVSLDILDVPPHQKNGKEVQPHQHISVAYGLIAPMKQTLKVKPDENSEVKWINLDDMQNKCEEEHMLVVYYKIIDRMQDLKRKKEEQYTKLPKAFLGWYRENARDLPWRKDKNPYHVWLSEIMLQQTRVEAVKAYYIRFLKELPNIEQLSKVEEDKLLKLWEGLGYYNRVRNLQKAARVIMDNYDGVFPTDYHQILSLPGIGEYTAGAIASICYEQAAPAVDGNVLRVISRIIENYESIEKLVFKKQVSDRLKTVYPRGQCGDFTQSIMEIGAIVCLPNGTPKCVICPAESFCMAHKNNQEELLPVKKKKKARRIEEKTVFVLSCGDHIAIKQRMDESLLSGLWELPNIPKVDMKEAIGIASQWGVSPIIIEKEIEKKHIFTHIEWRMTCYYLRCQTQTEEFTWVSKEQLEKEFALPTAFRQFLNPV